jgi:hypothetical protein
LRDFLIIHFLEGMHQGDLLIGTLFVLTPFHVLQFSMMIVNFCKFFTSFANDTHIISLAFIVHFAFDHFVFQLVFVGFVFHPYKCLA